MRFFKVFICIFASITFALAAGSCASDDPGTVFVDGAYQNTSTGIRYVACPMCYQAVERGEAYSEVDVGKGNIYTLYEIVGLSPESWLVSEDGTVFRSEDISLKDLSVLTVTSIVLSHDSSSPVVFNTISDAAVIAEILGEYLDSETVEYQAGAYEKKVNVQMISNELPGIYYTVSYLEYAEDIITYEPVERMDVTRSQNDLYEKELEIDKNLESRLQSGEFDKYGKDSASIDKFIFNQTYTEDDEGMYFEKDGEYVLAQDETEIPPSSQRYSLESYSVEWSVKYNLGKYFYYNNVDGRFVPAGDYLHSVS